MFYKIILALLLLTTPCYAQTTTRLDQNTKAIKSGYTYFATTETQLVAAQSDSSVAHVTLVSPISLTASRSITKPLYVNGGAIITTTGYTLTLSGGFEAGNYQAFNSVPGEVVVGSVPKNNLQVDPRHFGAVGDGSNDDTNAFQCAAAFLRSAGTGTLLIPIGSWKITSSINCTRLGSYSSFNILGQDPIYSKIIGDTGDTPVFDFSACRYGRFSSFSIWSGSTNPSTTGFYLNRDSTKNQSGDMSFDNIYMHISHSATANSNNGSVGIYMIASEGNIVTNCHIIADNPMVVASSNIFGISSQFISVFTGSSSMTDLKIIGGWLKGISGPALYLDTGGHAQVTCGLYASTDLYPAVTPSQHAMYVGYWTDLICSADVEGYYSFIELGARIRNCRLEPYMNKHTGYPLIYSKSGSSTVIQDFFIKFNFTPLTYDGNVVDMIYDNGSSMQLVDGIAYLGNCTINIPTVGSNISGAIFIPRFSVKSNTDIVTIATSSVGGYVLLDRYNYFLDGYSSVTAAEGDFVTSQSGKGLIVTSQDGMTTKRIGIDNSGSITLTDP